MDRFLDLALHLALAALLPPLLLGLVNRTKAAFAGRAGAPVLQPYYDLARLWRKGTVLSRTTTWVFLAGPVLGAATAALAALLVPVGGRPAPVAFAGDFLLFAYALALGRFFTVAAALDTGSAFEGMGGAREATYACLAEPALFFAMMVPVRLTGSFSLSEMLGPGLAAAPAAAGASLVLVVAALFVVLLAEACRIPFDDPNTHLELTMIHEVMVLDHSGPALALIQYGAALKLYVFAALVVRLALPVDAGGPVAARVLATAAMAALAIGVGVVESVMARLKLTQIPSLLTAACLLAAFGVILLAV